MNRFLASLVFATLIYPVAHAATTNTTLTVNASAATSYDGISATGSATLSNIGSGAFSGALNLATVNGPAANVHFTITLSGGTIAGTLQIPVSLLLGTAASGTGLATITGGAGAYVGATGSFALISGTATGSIATGVALTFSGQGSITTVGSGGGPTAPTISAVLDAGSYTANIAQGSIFVVKGGNLSAAGFTQYDFPLPTNPNGVKITFTPAAGGAGMDAYMIYAYNQGGTNQLAALLPVAVAAGDYKVTVTSGGATSTPFTVTVVERKPGLITQDGTGTGLAVVQNYISAGQLDVNRLTTGSVSGVTISPAKPGQVLIAWATGLGPVNGMAFAGEDSMPSKGYDFLAHGVTVRAIVGNVAITPEYAGRAPGLAGIDQINFRLPADIPTGCSVPFQISVNDVMSNPTTISIAPDASASACVQPGYTTQQLEALDQGKSITFGALYLSQISQALRPGGSFNIAAAGGVFSRITAFQFAAVATAPEQQGSTSAGDCNVFRSTNLRVVRVSPATPANLDAGAVTLNGPAGSNISNLVMQQDPTLNTYSLTLASNGTFVAGTYSVSGAGGKDIGKFNASLTVGPPIVITGGLPSTINRSADLTLNWTGGNPADIVQITGSSNEEITNVTSFSCTTTAGQRTLTVPASILRQLPTQDGWLSVSLTPDPSAGNGKFSAPLTAGGTIDVGSFLGLNTIGAAVSFQ